MARQSSMRKKWEKMGSDPDIPNHFNPGGLTNNINHVLLDVFPYFILGNDEKILPNPKTPTDSTWAIDRISRILYRPYNYK